MRVENICPSLICLDLCNLERDVSALENAGCRTLHVDVLDGYFSPSMPVGLDTIRQLRAKTAMRFDAHVMAMRNDFFIEQLLDIGTERICFQIETERHVARKLTLLKNAGVQAGIALSPATPVAGLEYALELCDFVLLMMINPGYASFGGEARYPFMPDKIRRFRDMIAERGLDTEIEIDGRVALADMRAFDEAGAEAVVLGTSALSGHGDALGASFRKVLAAVAGAARGGDDAL